MSLAAKILVLGLAALLAAVVFLPGVRQYISRAFTSTETLSVEVGAGDGTNELQELELVTLLGFDAIPAILNPDFVSAEQADEWMELNERVLGLSINGERKAYSIKMLSRHEIVNDTVGGVPLAVTW